MGAGRVARNPVKMFKIKQQVSQVIGGGRGGGVELDWEKMQEQAEAPAPGKAEGRHVPGGTPQGREKGDRERQY